MSGQGDFVNKQKNVLKNFPVGCILCHRFIYPEEDAYRKKRRKTIKRRDPKTGCYRVDEVGVWAYFFEFCIKYAISNNSADAPLSPFAADRYGAYLKTRG